MQVVESSRLDYFLAIGPSFAQQRGRALDKIEDPAKMTNSEIADAWAEHYPRRHERQVSRQVCNLISELIRAKSSVDSSDINPAFRVIVVLDTLGIPQEQFEMFNGEDVAGH